MMRTRAALRQSAGKVDDAAIKERGREIRAGWREGCEESGERAGWRVAELGTLALGGCRHHGHG